MNRKDKMAERNSTPYENSREHLADELEKLDALLSLQVMTFRETHSRNNGDALAGFYIGEEEVDRAISKQPTANKGPGANSLIKQIQTIREKIAERIEKSVNAGVYLPFLKLSQVFQLTPFEMDILLVCLAPELDLEYEKLYAYLQDDITKKSPSVSLILDLLCRTAGEKIDARTCFFTQAPLLKYRLLKFTADGMDRPLLTRNLKPDDRIVNFLLEQDGIDDGIKPFVELTVPSGDWPGLLMENDLSTQLNRLSETFFDEDERTGVIFYLKGPYGAGKKSAAEAFCHRLNLPLLIVDIDELPAGDSPADTGEILDRVFREALLLPAVIYFDHFDRLTAHGPGESREPYVQNAIARAVETFSLVVFLAGETAWNPLSRLKTFPVIKIELSIPSFQIRKQLWEISLNSGCPLSPGVDIGEIAGKFKFTGGQIRDAAAEARQRAAVSGTLNKEGLTMADLYHGCRARSNHNLSRMARKLTPHYAWPDIVLPPDKLRQLKEMCNYVKYRHIVYHEWGFHRKLSLGKGLNILFSGPSGTGKTMAAEIVANELKLDFYKIDLSCVVSKYIGETEKNLAVIFKEAETANAILFFDEADALFGKRSEVKDSHDRYANLEINYLLQKMEEHEGIVILATNFRRNVDEAFNRRMHFSVDFPFPDEAYRLHIWKKIFPVETPRGRDIDFEFLAGQFKISGGSIKNIAVNAAFLAADYDEDLLSEDDAKKAQPGTGENQRGRPRRGLDMKHIIHATRREYQKMGRMCSEGDFKEYFPLVKDM